MSTYEISIKRVKPIRVCAVRDVVPTYGHVSELFDRLFKEMGARGIAPTGPTMAIYYDREYTPQDVDAEAAVPVAAEELDAGEGCEIRDLPAYEEMATVLHRGPYDDFTPAYDALMKWIEEHGYRIIGPNREHYLTGPEAGVEPDAYVTEIQFPVTQA
jgi:effector-binding domain-containing protein